MTFFCICSLFIFNLAHILSELHSLRTGEEVHTVPGEACCTLTCVASLKCVAAQPLLCLNTLTHTTKTKKRDQTTDEKTGNGVISFSLGVGL